MAKYRGRLERVARRRSASGEVKVPGASRPRRYGTARPVRMLVIDAANVIGSRPTGWWRDRPGATRDFTERVRATVTAGRLGSPVTIVLDAEPGQEPMRRTWTAWRLCTRPARATTRSPPSPKRIGRWSWLRPTAGWPNGSSRQRRGRRAELAARPARRLNLRNPSRGMRTVRHPAFWDGQRVHLSRAGTTSLAGLLDGRGPKAPRLDPARIVAKRTSTTTWQAGQWTGCLSTGTEDHQWPQTRRRAGPWVP